LSADKLAEALETDIGRVRQHTEYGEVACPGPRESTSALWPRPAPPIARAQNPCQVASLRWGNDSLPSSGLRPAGSRETRLAV
jgi:hypothetical protein